MPEEQRPQITGATAVVGAHRYALADRTGHKLGEVPLATIVGLIRQGRLFRTDKVSKNGATMQPLGELPEFEELFSQLLPQAFHVDGTALRPAPELSGEADTLTLARLFGTIYRERRTGRLFLCDADHAREKVVSFRQGTPISANSNTEEEWIGELLIGHGIIDRAAFDEAVEHARVHGKRIGSALIYLEKLSPRELKRALSVQAMERLLNAFRMKGGTWQFIADESAAEDEILLVASPRDIIETGLSAALGAREVTEILAGYGDPTFRVEGEEVFANDLHDTDKAMLRILGAGQPLSRCLDRVAQAGRLTPAEARLRVLALMQLGVLKVGGAEVEALETALHTLEATDFYRMLDVRRAASPEEIEGAWRQKVVEFEAAPRPEDAEAVKRLREKIAATLDRARRTLQNPEERAMYERAVQLGLDFEQPEVRRRLEHEQAVHQGNALLRQQKYTEAFDAFSRAGALIPDDPQVYVQLGWARFLASDRTRASAGDAIADVERALRLSREFDEGYVTMGKIHRLTGDLAQAEADLRRAIEINPHNNEAQSELRLLFTRELNQGSRIKIDLSSSKGFVPLIAVALVTMVVLYVGANLVPGGLTVWPDVQTARAEATGAKGGGGAEAELYAAVVERLQGDVDLTVPNDKRVMGNAEYYFLADDAWWWVRRGLLLVVGLLGVLLINRDRLGDIRLFGKQPAWIMAALPYGLLLGFLTPVPDTPTALWPALGMGLVHVLAEVVFFFVFLARGLMKQLDEPLIAVAIVFVVYALYRATFFATLAAPGTVMLQDILQGAAFIGGVYALLVWRSGGIFAPLLAHLLLIGLMMVRATVL